MSHFEHTINLRWVCHLHLIVNFSVLDPCLIWAKDPDEKCHKGNWFCILKSLSWFLCSFAFEIAYFMWRENHLCAAALLQDAKACLL